MYQFIMEDEWFEKSGTKKKSDLNDNNKRGEGGGNSTKACTQPSPHALPYVPSPPQEPSFEY